MMAKLLYFLTDLCFFRLRSFAVEKLKHSTDYVLPSTPPALPHRRLTLIGEAVLVMESVIIP